ncbi:MsnO8 family LLM class oxidoreductase [Nocardia zapadnayensis]|uniref:MsnO8 family LLM class oxidoreductase n=1 Tax=Nocardia rhamnosiphila TaxID=426716 RepID=UPI0022482859|nr:MsnO8 family LLM class oxidoreductase [Nocardia zapadnayensis]MCX0275473.1 MsnO8 family LLM class oxidoreductase [Nocardia zapadnayensis]
MELSLLDRSRTRAGEPESAALSHTVERAVAAEKSGYRRFWVAEHHAVPGIASGSPPVLLAALGSRTSTIRIGSGGVMLPHHQPLVVAEQFLMLEALFPGRIDLGLGRSPAFTAPVRRAMRQDENAPDRFTADLAELRDYLDGAGPVTAHPVSDRTIPMFVLATGQGLAVAARLGLPAVLGGPLLDSPESAAALAGYRRNFRPSPRAARPRVTLALEVTVAETDEEARALVLPEAWAMARSRSTGVFPPLEPVGESASWTDQMRRRVEAAVRRAVAGTPQTVRRRIEQLTDRTGAEELLATTSTYDRAALAASDAELARIITG